MSDGQQINDMPPVQPNHYRLLCAIALGAIFLVQLQQGLVLWGVAVVLLGALAILIRVRIGPLVVLLPLVGSQLYIQYTFPMRRPHGLLQVEDVVLCTAALAYLGGHYRLLSLWRSILPADPRQRYHRELPVIVPVKRLGKVALQHRSASLLSGAELARFVLQLPMFALLAQGAWLLLGARRELHDLSPRWIQFMLLVWGLALGLFIVGQLVRTTRLLQMDRLTAKMVLQDSLWHQTRGEQRRIARWLAWWKLKQESKAKPGQSI